MSDQPASAPSTTNPDFHAHHAPVGAYLSFTCGNVGQRGGLGIELGQAAKQDVYVGVRAGPRAADGPLVCLPFFAGASADDGARFTVEQTYRDPNQPDAQPALDPYPLDRMTRRYGLGTDRFITDDLEFAVYSPATRLPDPGAASAAEVRAALLPAVVAELVIDNRGGREPKTGFLCINFNEPGVRLLEAEPATDRAGFALRADAGVLATVWDEPSGALQAPLLFCRWTVDEGLRESVPHRLGTCPGVGIEVPPGRRQHLRIALGCYLDRVVTTGLAGRYLYTRHYRDLEDVLGAALDRFTALRQTAEAQDRELGDTSLTPDQQQLVAHATRSYYGNTQLLEIDGAPAWIVNEGEYAMMNTLDLSVDQVFFELDQNPWVVKNLLDWFVRDYSYRDALGLSFVHDMGVHNNFAPRGRSTYELPGLSGCFSFMTQEQLCNFILTAACYVARTGDREFVRDRRETLRACLDSMLARGPGGIMRTDSSRCEGGSEITTYDSLDPSLGQARNNLYLAVKCWAATLGLLVMTPDAPGAWKQAVAIARTLTQQAATDGVIPAVFEADSPGHASRILPAVEGLVYPTYWSSVGVERGPHGGPAAWVDPEGPFGELVQALRRHTLTLLRDPERRNLFDDGGLKLSSSSDNSWFSKIALLQHVARETLGLDAEADIRALFARADAAHVAWQTEGSSAWACSDQFVRGRAEGSRYYPRGVTTWLWLMARRATGQPTP